MTVKAKVEMKCKRCNFEGKVPIIKHPVLADMVKCPQCKNRVYVDPVKQTHGILSHFIGEKDDVARSINILRLENGVVSITWETYWDGLAKEPTKTTISLGTDVINHTLRVLTEFLNNREQWKLPEARKK